MAQKNQSKRLTINIKPLTVSLEYLGKKQNCTT